MSENSPNKIPEKAILSYAQMGNPMFEFKIEQHHEEFFLILVVDCEKIDVNSGKFDSKYKNELIDNAKTGIQAFIHRPIKRIESIAEDIKKFFGVEVRVSFGFKNYKFLNKIESEIKRAIKQTSRPDLIAVMSADGDNPKIKLGFYNFKRTKVENETVKYIDELQEVLGSKIDLESYRVFTSESEK
jgi:hypothetical protein